jgi:pyruvate ferredoxin oxidoreductase alpha subunit
MELKYQQMIAMKNASLIIPKVFQEFGELTGRHYSSVESYMMEDADYAFVTLGAISGTTREFVKKLRAQGEKVGLVKLRTFRPFPAAEVVIAIKDVKGAMVIERSLTFGAAAAMVYSEIATSFVAQRKIPPILSSMTAGIGGRDVGVHDIMDIYHILKQDVENNTPSHEWWNVRM